MILVKATKTIIGTSALVLAAGAVLSACVEAEDPRSATSAGPGSEPPAVSPDVPTTDVEAAGDDEQSASNGSVVTAPWNCIVGTWLTDNTMFRASLESYGDVKVISVSGEVFDTFHEDGSRTTEYRNWEWTAETDGHTMTFERTGIDRGEWTATESTISMSATDMGSTITVIGPATMTLDPEPERLEHVPYTCDGDQATVTAYGHTHPLSRQ